MRILLSNVVGWGFSARVAFIVVHISIAGGCSWVGQGAAGGSPENLGVGRLAKPSGLPLTIRGPNTTVHLAKDDDEAVRLTAGEQLLELRSAIRGNPAAATCHLRVEAGHDYRLTSRTPMSEQLAVGNVPAGLVVEDRTIGTTACVFLSHGEPKADLPNVDALPPRVQRRQIRWTGRFTRPPDLMQHFTANPAVLLVPFLAGHDRAEFERVSEREFQYTSDFRSIPLPAASELDYEAEVPPGRYLLVLTGVKGGGGSRDRRRSTLDLEAAEVSVSGCRPCGGHRDDDSG